MPHDGAPSVIVVGGGVAGIAASSALAESGCRVTLIERRGVLGGRASSFADHETGSLLDSCKHVTLACCTNLHALLARLCVERHVHYMRSITLQGSEGRSAQIAGANLPPPLHAAPSLMMIPWLSLSDKISLARVLSRLPRPGAPSAAGGFDSFASWAVSAGVTPAAMRGFLEPVIASACNAPPNEVSLAVAASVLRNGFLATRTGGRLGLFHVPLVELFDGPCRTTIESQGGSVMTHAAVDSVGRNAAGIYSVRLRSGEALAADVCVVATTASQACRILTGLPPADALRHLERTIVGSPIVATHLWFDRPFVCPPALGLVGRATHWVFTAPAGPVDSARTSYLATVSSADRPLAALPLEAIRDSAVCDARAALSIPSAARLTRWRVIRTREATFVPSDGTEVLRPDQRTVLPGLYLAGDWTQTGWPATMEGAARSGHLAAQMALEDCGRPRGFLEPDGSVV